MILMGLMMSSYTEYVFHFNSNGDVTRIPRARWNRIREGEESVKEFANEQVHIAYAYILLENRNPDYCPRIDGAIYYFDKAGKVILEQPHYHDLLQDLDEQAGGVINLQHRKKTKEVAEKYHWTLKPKQIQKVIDCIW